MGVRAHRAYLRYVLIHKLYVFVAGVAIGGWRPSWLWRLFIHDFSKFRPSEWRPYVENFYGAAEAVWTDRRAGQLWRPDIGETRERVERQAAEEWQVEKKRRQAAFNYAWLLHQHRNAHHWQHWILKEDSGKTLVLTPPASYVDEMVADWIGAGTKILGWPTLSEAVAATVAWYAANRERIILREHARARVEETLHGLATKYGLLAMALEVESAKAARASIVIPGR